jgi:hypothetical protein
MCDINHIDIEEAYNNWDLNKLSDLREELWKIEYLSQEAKDRTEYILSHSMIRLATDKIELLITN